MIGKCKVIVNGLRNTKEFLGLSGNDGIIRQLLDGIHGIISADVDKCIDFQFVQNIKDFLIDSSVFVDFRKLITAGTKKCRRGPFQKLNVKLGMNLGRKVDILLVKQTLDSVKHSIYLVKATLYCILIYTCKTRINYRCWASGLSYNNISFLCHRGIPPLFWIIWAADTFSPYNCIVYQTSIAKSM